MKLWGAQVINEDGLVSGNITVMAESREEAIAKAEKGLSDRDREEIAHYFLATSLHEAKGEVLASWDVREGE